MVNLKQVKNMVKVYINIQVVIFMMVCGHLIEKMVKVYFTMLLLKLNMMVIGKKI